MRRRWKIAIGLGIGIVILLSLNALSVNGETKDAHINVPGARIVQAFGGDVQVDESGPADAPPMVLLHCFTCSMKWWDAILPDLDKDNHVIRIDLLGHGGSQKPAAGYDIDDQSAMVASVLSQLGVSNATVVGHSLGFAVATSLAVKSPDLVSRLVDIDEAADNSHLHRPLAERLEFVPLIGQALWRLTPDFKIRDTYKTAFAPGFNLAEGFQDPDQPIHDLHEMTYRSFVKSYNAESSYVGDEPLNQRLAPLGKPLLVIFGTEDQVFDPVVSADAYKSVPGAEIEMIQGAGHSPNVEKPQETAQDILEFAANPNNPATKPAKPEFKPPNKHKAPKHGSKKGGSKGGGGKHQHHKNHKGK